MWLIVVVLFDLSISAGDNDPQRTLIVSRSDLRVIVKRFCYNLEDKQWAAVMADFDEQHGANILEENRDGPVHYGEVLCMQCCPPFLCMLCFDALCFTHAKSCAILV